MEAKEAARDTDALIITVESRRTGFIRGRDENRTQRIQTLHVFVLRYIAFIAFMAVVEDETSAHPRSSS